MNEDQQTLQRLFRMLQLLGLSSVLNPIQETKTKEIMPKLHQILAVANGKKTQTQQVITRLNHELQQIASFQGLARVYRPIDDNGEQLPPESKRVQRKVDGLIDVAMKQWTLLFDSVATIDSGNTQATADVIVDGQKLLEYVPVTTLLFLEKQLLDIASFVTKIPTLDPAYDWTWDDAANCYAATPVETTRTKKIPKAHVLYEATDKHPAQVETYTEDIVVGYWKKIDFSSAVPEKERAILLKRVQSLRESVVTAREAANSREVTQKQMGKRVFDYLFALPTHTESIFVKECS